MTSVTSAPPQADPLQKQLANLLEKRGQFSDQAIWFRLKGGRTNKTWRVTDARSTFVVKLYSPDGKNPLFPNNYKDEAKALSALATTQLAPNLVVAGETPFGPVLIYEHLEGSMWRSGTSEVASLLYKLHQRPLFENVPDRPNGSDALMMQVRHLLNQCASQKSESIWRMKPKGSVPRIARLAPLHGDPVPGNIVVTSGGLRLIDWQCPASGDPCEDIALFLSPSMQLAYRGAILSPVETEAFLQAYPDPIVVRRYRSLSLWYHWRMAAYCLWRSEQGHVQDVEYGSIESNYLVAV